MRPEYHETETKTKIKKSCETKTRNHETMTSLVYSNLCENEINRYTDIFAITVIYGYESQRTGYAVSEVSAI